MNRPRGLKRLAIAVGVPWFGWWGLVAWINYGRLHDPHGSPEQLADAYDRLGGAFWWGIIIPVLLGAVLAVALWVYRGFKPKP